MSKVTIASIDGHASVTGLMGQNAARINDGLSSWDLVNRPRKTALTQYNGRNPFGMIIDLIFDGFIQNQTQERKIKTLLWMSLPSKGKNEPTPVRLYGPLPFPSGGNWVISNIEYGDMTIWDKTESFRIRQDVTVSLKQHVASDRITLLDAGLGLFTANPKKHTVKLNDTIGSIALKHYGDARFKWKIAEANLLRDPTNLKIGTELRIP